MPPKAALVLGKFMPLHKGHEALFRFAAAYAERLYVVVDHLAEEPISGSQRVAWVRQAMPDAEVFYLPHAMPQEPDDRPDFWRHWCEVLLQVLPAAPTILVASEPYGATLAELLGAAFVRFDFARLQVNISASAIRRDIAGHWAFLSAAAQKTYRLRVAVVGPESTGKTTLCEQLAVHYGTLHVPEYARQYMQMHRALEETDMLKIAQGQVALAHEREPHAARVMFSDTDAITTSIWQRWLFGRPHAEIDRLAAHAHHDCYLLLAPDISWVADPVRLLPNRGQEFFDDCRRTLETQRKQFRIVSGHGAARTAQAIAFVDAWLAIRNQIPFPH